MGVLRFLRFAAGFLLAAGTIALLFALSPPEDPPPIGLPPGSVEFLIVANKDDDAEAIKAVELLFDDVAGDTNKRAELRKLALEGKPPLPPQGKYKVGKYEVVGSSSYRWVQVDQSSVADLVSDVRIGESTDRERAQEARLRGRVFVRFDRCIWSRNCENALLTEAERIGQGVEWFLLLRESDVGDEITERHLAHIQPGKDVHEGRVRPIINFKMTREGAKRMERLTGKQNPKKDQVWRSLAIVINGKVISFPRIMSEISDEFQISGEFNEQYVDDLVKRVRSAGK